MFRPLPTDEDLSGQRAGGWPRLLALRRSSPENDLVNLGAERAPSFALTASDPARTRGPAGPATSRLLIVITAGRPRLVLETRTAPRLFGLVVLLPPVRIILSAEQYRVSAKETRSKLQNVVEYTA